MHTALSFAPKELARRLIDRVSSAERTTGVAAPPEAALGTMFRSLTRWFGIDGTRALFTRAVAVAKTEHSALEGIRVRDSEPYFEGWPAKAVANGKGTNADSVEALILTVIVLLERQIGPELTAKLVDPDALTVTGNADRSNETGAE